MGAASTGDKAKSALGRLEQAIGWLSRPSKPESTGAERVGAECAIGVHRTAWRR